MNGNTGNMSVLLLLPAVRKISVHALNEINTVMRLQIQRDSNILGFLSMLLHIHLRITVQILCIGTDRSQQTVQTKIRLLLKKQSDQGLRCLPFHQHLLDA